MAIVGPTPRLIAEGDHAILYLGFENMSAVTVCCLDTKRTMLYRKRRPRVRQIKKSDTVQNSHGTFHHADMIGKPYGTKVALAPRLSTATVSMALTARWCEQVFSRGKGRTGWLYVLAPTPDLWTQSLPHRTQAGGAPHRAEPCALCGDGAADLVHRRHQHGPVQPGPAPGLRRG